MTYALRPKESDALLALRGRVDQLDAAVEKLQGGTADLNQLTSRIEALEQAAPPGIDEELQARLDALQQSAPPAELQARLQALEEAAPATKELADRVAALEQSVSSGTSSQAADQRIQALQEEVAKLSATVAAQALGEGDTTTSDLATLETLQSRLAALESELPQPQAAADVAQRLDALAQRVDALEPLTEQSAGNQGRIEGLASQIDGLEEQIQGLGERSDQLRAEVEDMSARLADTQERLAATSDRREEAAALALLTNQIGTAIAQSRGYEAPLRSLTALGKNDDVVRAAADQLAPSAASGVPSLAQLRRSFENVAPEIVRSARAPEGDSLIDRAAGNLLRLVTVRPVGADVEGNDPAARVARAEAHLAAGDLAAAVAEVEALEGRAAEAAAGWLADAKRRLAASAALERLQTRTSELLTPAQ